MYSIDITWDAPSNIGGSPITAYVVEHSAAGAAWKIIRPDDPADATTTETISNLIAGSKHAFRVAAVNVAGQGAYSNTLNVTTTDAAKPGTLTISTSDVGYYSIDITWDAPSNIGGSPITAYVVEHSAAGAAWEIIRPDDPADATTTETISNLIAGSKHAFRVAAVNVAGQGVYSNTLNVTTTDAAKPGTLTISTSDVGYYSIDITWDAPSNIGGSPITAYVVEHSAAGAAWKIIRPDDPADATTTETISNLIAGSKHAFRVAAVNVAGQGVYSNTLNVTTTDAAKPGTLTISTSDVGYYSIDITWDAPSNIGGSPITAYVVEHSAAGAAWKIIRPDDPADATTTETISNLIAGSKHAFRVAAVNVAGQGVYSNTLNVTTTDAAKPGTLTITASDVGYYSIDITWDAPSNIGGSPITAYVVEHSAAGAAWEIIRSDDPADATTTETISNLIAGSKHAFRVAAVNVAGQGAYSNTLNVTTTDAAKPGTLTITASDVGYYSIDITWDAPSNIGGSPITAYVVEHSAAGAAWEIIRPDDPADATTTETLSNLIAGSKHAFRVAAVNIAGQGAYSNTLNVTTTDAAKPGTLTITASDVGYYSIDITWDAPSNIGGSPITAYVVEHSAAGAAWKIIRPDDPADATTTETISNLIAGSKHAFRVAAVNVAGQGAYSNTLNVTTTDAAKPGTLTITASDVGYYSIGITWDAPSNIGGSPITAYVVEHSAAGAAWEIIRSDDPADATTTETISNLIAGSKHAFRVAAVNVAGQGVYSNTLNVTTTDAAKPGTLTISTSDVGYYSIGITWDAPSNIGGSPITAYVVEHSAAGAAWEIIRPDDPADATTTETISNLIAGSKHAFRVAAVNVAGQGAYSNTLNVTTTDAAKPGTLTISTSDVGYYSIDITWDAPSNIGGSPITAYVVEHSAAGAAWKIIRPDDPADATTTETISNLIAGSKHAFRVAAVNVAGQGVYSNTLNVTTTDAAKPGTLTISTSDVGYYSIDITWDAPSNIGGSPITAYVVEHSAAGAAWEIIRPDDPADATTTETISNLIAGSKHAFRVAAVNVAGQGVYSNTLNVTTTDAAKPGTLTISTSDVGYYSIDITWDAPSNIGGSPITAYVVEHSAAGAAWEIIRPDDPADATTTETISNLIAGSKHAFRVAAVNVAGQGVYSNTLNVTTTDADRIVTYI